MYAEGKKVTIKATAAKGYVFAGWYETAAEANGGGRGATALPAVSSKPPYLSLAASMNVIVPEMRYVFAKFVTAEEDRDSIALAVDGVEMAAGIAVDLAKLVTGDKGSSWGITADASISMAALSSLLTSMAESICSCSANAPCKARITTDPPSPFRGSLFE